LDLAIYPTKNNTSKIMIRKFFFRQMSLEKQVLFLKRKGVGLGTRLKDGRKIYIYMLNDLFVEVHYKNDNSSEPAEKVNMISGLMNLTQYLERDFRATF
jgi:hypothetical protein